MESQAPRVTVEGFDGPLDLLLELVEERKLEILTVRLGDLADAYLARVRAMARLPADEVSAFLALASRLVLLKARSLLPSLEPLPEDEGETEEELRARLLEYAVVRERDEEIVAPGERYSVDQRTAEISALVEAHGRVSFGTLLGDAPTVGFAVVTFIALLDLYRRGVIDLVQEDLFADILVTRRERS